MVDALYFVEFNYNVDVAVVIDRDFFGLVLIFMVIIILYCIYELVEVKASF